MATGNINYSLEYSWSTGFQIEGKPWRRERDVFAFAVGQIFPAKDYKKYSVQILQPKAKPENHLEMYYNIYINDHLSLSPDFQYIWNPFGRDVEGDTDGIFIGGIRAQFDF